jgi:hypothetical protein
VGHIVTHNLQPQLTNKYSGLSISEIEIPNFDDKRAKLDILSCLSRAASLSDLELSRLAWIKHNPIFRTWIMQSNSAAIHIDGNADDDPAAYSSATSFLCAETAHLFEAVQKTIVLSYFCGLSAAPSAKGHAEPRAMVSSLLGQLLQYKDEEALQDAVIENSLYEGVQSSDVDALFSAFEALVLQLPQSWTVVCFIDSIDYLETQKYSTRTCNAIRKLLKLVKRLKKQKGATFELLVTASKVSLVVGKEFRAENRIFCPEVPVYDANVPFEMARLDR